MTNNLFSRAFLLIGLIVCCSPVLSAQDDTAAGPRNDVKVTLLSLGSGSSRFTYERAVTSATSAELTLGVIGWGFDIMNHADPSGLLVKAAYKWNILPMRRAHTALAGFYLKPEFVFASYDYTWSDSEAAAPSESRHTTQGALLAECGYQLVLRWFVFDIYTGLGPSFGTSNAHNYYHSFMLFPADSHLATTAGFRLGVAF